MVKFLPVNVTIKIEGAFQIQNHGNFHVNHGEPVTKAVSQLDRSQLEFIAKLYEYRPAFQQ